MSKATVIFYKNDIRCNPRKKMKKNEQGRKNFADKKQSCCRKDL